MVTEIILSPFALDYFQIVSKKKIIEPNMTKILYLEKNMLFNNLTINLLNNHTINLLNNHTINFLNNLK